MDYYAFRNSLSYNDFYNYMAETRRDEVCREYIPVSVVNDFAVSVAQVKEHLKLDSDNDIEANKYYEMLITAATMVGEFVTRIEFIEKEFYLYMNSLPDQFKLLKSPVQSIVSIEYLHTDNVTWVAVDPTVYYLAQSKYYPTVCLDSGKYWPTINNGRNHCIRVRFKTGFSKSKGVPHDIQLALLNHVAVLHEQRGDWGNMDLNWANFIQSMPAFTQLAYSRYRITNRR